MGLSPRNQACLIYFIISKDKNMAEENEQILHFNLQLKICGKCFDITVVRYISFLY